MAFDLETGDDGNGAEALSSAVSKFKYAMWDFHDEKSGRIEIAVFFERAILLIQGYLFQADRCWNLIFSGI
jgi:hypothetical protein